VLGPDPHQAARACVLFDNAGGFIVHRPTEPMTEPELLGIESWPEDQLDPDNWMQIPEFGVNPEDVDFSASSIPSSVQLDKNALILRCQ
jgi:hypothetical protein